MMFTHAELRVASRGEHIMSMPVVHQHRWTAPEVERLIEDRVGHTPRYELVGGELLVTPAPTWRHQRIVVRLTVLLDAYLSRHRVGEVLTGPAELKLVTGERYELDVFVVPLIDARVPNPAESTIPLLVIEVLSPGSARHDRITKRRAFQENEVPEYWIVDGDAEAFEVWRPGDERPALVDDRIEWKPAGASEAFELDVAEFFGSISPTSE
jgi:Uma2 family endonuclease